MRTWGSPNTPRTATRGRNPGKRYTSTNRRTLPIAKSSNFLSLGKLRKALCQRAFNSYALKIHPHDFKETRNLKDQRDPQSVMVLFPSNPVNGSRFSASSARWTGASGPPLGFAFGTPAIIGLCWRASRGPSASGLDPLFDVRPPKPEIAA
jgi:hypothetical protein